MLASCLEWYFSLSFPLWQEFIPGLLEVRACPVGNLLWKLHDIKAALPMMKRTGDSLLKTSRNWCIEQKYIIWSTHSWIIGVLRSLVACSYNPALRSLSGPVSKGCSVRIKRVWEPHLWPEKWRFCKCIDQQHFPLKVIDLLGFVSYTFSVTATQLCHQNTKEAICNI